MPVGGGQWAVVGGGLLTWTYSPAATAPTVTPLTVGGWESGSRGRAPPGRAGAAQGEEGVGVLRVPGLAGGGTKRGVVVW
jgi:hypothetical protein